MLGEGAFHQEDILADILVSQHLACEPNIEGTTSSRFCDIDYDVGVKLIGRSAIIRVLAQKEMHRLLDVLPLIESLHLKVMQINITNIEDSVLYYLNVKVCSLSIS